MKKSLMLAVLAAAGYLMSSAANAGILATVPNKVGGTLHLTDGKNNCNPGSFYAFILRSDQQLQGGCWSYILESNYEMIQITWSDGRTMVYPSNIWDMTPYGTNWMQRVFGGNGATGTGRAL